MFFYALIDAIKDFHAKIGNRAVGCMPANPNLALCPPALACQAFSKQLEKFVDSSDPRFLRAHLLLEELSETLLSMSEGDEVGVLDGLTDLLYVLLGVAVVFDLPIEEAFWEVHKSNMTKIPQSNDQSRTRVRLKGPSFVPPDLASVLRVYRELNSKSQKEI